MGEARTFSYVRIPADDSESVEEISATTSVLGDALPDILKPRFAGGSIKNAEGLRSEYGSAVDEKMEQLNLIASAGSVEVFALIRPSETTMPIKHAGTYFYFDEMGVLKGLSVNQRAAKIAASCGLDVESPFLGDVYIGRVVVNPSPMRNGDFALAELDSSSPWMRSAPSENAQYQMAMAEYEKAAKAKTEEGKGRAGIAGGSTGSSERGGVPLPGSYKWAQTGEDLEVTVALPGGTQKRDVSIKVGPKSLDVRVKSQEAPVAQLALFAKVLPDEMTWTFNANGGGSGSPHVQVMVEKAEGVSWTRLEAASEGQIC